LWTVHTAEAVQDSFVFWLPFHDFFAQTILNMMRAALVSFTMTVGLFAQQSDARRGTELLTLDKAVQEAIGKNLSLIAERLNIPVAEARIVQARLRPNPVLSFGSDYNDWLGTGFNAANGAGPAEVNARVDFVIEGGHKRERRIEVAEGARSVAQLQLLNTTRQLILDVQSAFVDVLAAKENLDLANQNLKALNALVDVNSSRVRAGDLAQVELVRSRIAALQFRNAVQQSELKLRTARGRLALLMGRNGLAPDVEVGGPLRSDQDLIVLDELRAQSLNLRPDLQALVKDQARSQADIRLQLAQGKVDYTVGTQYHRQYDNAKGNSLGLFLSVPLPVFNKNQGEIERARTEQQQIQARIRALQNSIVSEVQTAFQSWETSRSLLTNIEKDMLQQARDVRETTEYSYRRGEASLVEFLDAQRAFNETMQSYNDARAEYARSLYIIDAVTGKAVNP
jgi:outer membrane protein, heavy metal efflux system